MSAPVTDFIAMEARFGAQNYKPLGVTERVNDFETVLFGI